MSLLASPRPHPRAWRLGLLSLAVVICGGVGPRAAAQTLGGTARIPVVENRTPLWTPATAWRFSSAPLVQIGEVEGDSTLQFNRTRFATRLSDGRIVVAQSWELRVFSAAGKHLQTIGRRGQGPGEFALGVSAVVALPGDTIAVGQSNRIVYFDSRGSYVRSVPTVPAGLLRDHRSEGAQVLPDGSALITLYDPEPKEWQVGVMRPRQGFVRVAPGGARADTAGFFPGFEQVVVVGGSRPDIEIRPFARVTMATAGGDRVFIGDTERYAIRVYALANLRPLMEIRRAVPPVEVTSLAKAQWAERRRRALEAIPANRRALEQPYLERAIQRADFPRTMPAFAGLIADRRGNLWVRETPETPPDSGFAVFDREGRFLGEVAPPRGVTVLEIGSDYMIGLWRNEEDVEFVRVYGLVKP